MQNKRGFALVIALIIALMLSLLCLSLTLSSMQELQIGSEFENHEKALLIADAGFNIEKHGLRGDMLNALLSKSTNVAVYDLDPAHPDWAIRNPISPIDARNIDFAHMPSGATSISVSGLLTSATGTEIPGSPGARYFARLSDNNDGDNNTTVDQDGTVFLRVIGIQQGNIVENGSRRNSVAIIEAELHRDESLEMTSPFSMIGQHVVASFQGEPFLVDGYNHPGHVSDYEKGKHKSPQDDTGLVPFYGIQCLYETPGTENAQPAVNEINGALTKVPENVTGIGGTNSVTDGTEQLTGDAKNVLDAAYMYSLATKLKAAADIVLPGGTTLGEAGYGTWQAPKITYVDGNASLKGGFEGAGILLVRGDLAGNGSYTYEGLILVLGSGQVSMEGSNKVILGGLVAANFDTSGGNVKYGTTGLRLHGNDEFLFSGDAINMAIRLLPLRVLSWREITPEVEPIPVQVATQTP